MNTEIWDKYGSVYIRHIGYLDNLALKPPQLPFKDNYFFLWLGDVTCAGNVSGLSFRIPSAAFAFKVKTVVVKGKRLYFYDRAFFLAAQRWRGYCQRFVTHPHVVSRCKKFKFDLFDLWGGEPCLGNFLTPIRAAFLFGRTKVLRKLCFDFASTFSDSDIAAAQFFKYNKNLFK